MEKLYSLNLKHIIKISYKEGLSFFLICIYLFFEYVRPQSIYKQIDIFPWVPFIIGSTLIVGFVRGDFSTKTNCLIRNLLNIYAIIAILSIVVSHYAEFSVDNLRIFFDWYIIFFLIIKIVNNEKRFFIFFILFLLFSFKMSQHGFLSWVHRGFNYYGWGVTGAPGWFHNSGEVGIQMCMFTPLAVAFIVSIYRYINKFTFILTLLMPLTSIGTIIASSSRGAVLGLFGSGFWSVVRSRPKIFIIGLFCILFLYISVIYVMPDEFAQRFNTAGQDKTSLARMERWKHGLETLNKYPFLGIGLNAWHHYYSSNYTIEIAESLLVHNIFIQCGSELGYSGLIVFAAMILSCFLITRKVRKLAMFHDDKFLSILSYGFDSALIGFLISGSFVTVLYYPFFWVHCALTTCLHTVAVDKYDNRGGTDGQKKA
jgi:O-antigen ligase